MYIKEYLKPESTNEAYELLCSDGAAIIGGGAFLQLGDQEISKAVDISSLGLDYIIEDEGHIEIGAAVTLREIETSVVTMKAFEGVLSKAAAGIMGVQLRNVATIGGSVFGRYGFSDIITILLALDAKVQLYKAGTISLEHFLDSSPEKDLLLSIIIDKKVEKTFFQAIRKVGTDFSLLNAAAAIADGQLRLTIGGRPGRAKLAKGAMSFLNSIDRTAGAAGIAAILASEELTFGTDARASESYRKELCKSLVKRCVMEVFA